MKGLRPERSASAIPPRRQPAIVYQSGKYYTACLTENQAQNEKNTIFFPFSVDVSFFGVIFRVCFRNQKQEEGNGKQNMEMFFRR